MSCTSSIAFIALVSLPDPAEPSRIVLATKDRSTVRRVVRSPTASSERKGAHPRAVDDELCTDGEWRDRVERWEDEGGLWGDTAELGGRVFLCGRLDKRTVERARIGEAEERRNSKLDVFTTHLSLVRAAHSTDRRLQRLSLDCSRTAGRWRRRQTFLPVVCPL
jgi:hypothetical protein